MINNQIMMLKLHNFKIFNHSNNSINWTINLQLKKIKTKNN